MNTTHFNEWECPDCGWDPTSVSDGAFYYFDGVGISDCTEYDEVTNKIYGTPPEGFIAYPIYGPEEYQPAVAMEYGGNPVSWEETHFCPNCKIEFTVENSNF